MDEAHDLVRRVGDFIDAQQLRPRLLRNLAGSQQPRHEALLDLCMHQKKRQVAMAHLPQNTAHIQLNIPAMVCQQLEA